jgi:hypothetical protein
MWGKEGSKPGHKPVLSGYSALRCESEFRIQKKKSVPGGQICHKGVIGVGGRSNFLDDDCVPFKGAISFVGGEEERKLVME